MNKKNILLISSLLFIIATMWQQTLHEFGHFVAANLLNATDVVLYHNYVQYHNENLTVNNKIVVAAAGPLLSLVIGFLFHFICSQYKKRDVLFLFFLYMCAFGYICFFGYLMISPIFTQGDTGFIFQQWGFPLWLKIVIALGGVGLGLLSFKMIHPFFAGMANREILEEKSRRKEFADYLIQYPLYIGIAGTCLLNLPIPVWLSLIYPLCSPMALFWIHGYIEDTTYGQIQVANDSEPFKKVPIALIVILVITVVLNRFLVYGFQIH